MQRVSTTVRFERLRIHPQQWDEILAEFPDRHFFQTSTWLQYLSATEKGEIVIAAAREGRDTIGYFSGLMVRKFGLKILGSPFSGWRTSCMGMNVAPGIDRAALLAPLRRFAFSDLGCVQLDIKDWFLGCERGQDYAWRDSVPWDCPVVPCQAFEIDISLAPDEIMRRMQRMARRNIRIAAEKGVVVEETQDPGFADEFYVQLRDVFAKKNMVPTYGIERVRALLKHVLPTGMLSLLRACGPDGRCIATAMFAGIGERAFFCGSASWRKYQHLRANELLMWHGIKLCKARGMTRLELGGPGDYKGKYGGREMDIPWIQIPRYPALQSLRRTARTLFFLRNRLEATFTVAGEPSGSEPRAA